MRKKIHEGFENFKRIQLGIFTQSLIYLNPIGLEPGNSDPEIMGHLIQINAIPNIVTLQSCIGHQPLEKKYDGGAVWGEYGPDGVIWIAFANPLPHDCPLKYKKVDSMSEDIEYPVFAFSFRYHDFNKLDEFVRWLQTNVE